MKSYQRLFKGETVKAKVLISIQKERISLGQTTYRRPLLPGATIRKGIIVTTTVTKLLDTGIEVTVVITWLGLLEN